MSPVIPNSTLGISVAPGIPFISKRNKLISRCSSLRVHNKQTLFAQKYVIPLSTSIRLFPQFRIRCGLDAKKLTHVASATGTDVAVEEIDTSEADNEGSDAAVDTSEVTSESSEKTDPSTVKSKRPRSSRKSDMPPVKNEDLIPGATFTGKVRSIQPFGAFVDFGAFTDGLVHVSRLSDSFVKDVSNVVTIGQEVTVRLIEANFENGRISLSMRESDDPEKQKLQKDASLSSEKSGPPRKSGPRANRKKDEANKTSKFLKGQDLQGTVKNLTRSGAFISLPEGEEGFLPASEEANEGFGNIMGGSSLEVGQEVDVRVLRINRGQVTLTMKKEEDDKELDSKLSQGVVHKATNPFVVAFRSNKVISEFLDERVKEEEPVEGASKDAESEVSAVDGSSSETLSKDEGLETPIDDSPSSEVEETSSDVITDDLTSSIEDQIPEEPAQAEAEEEKETQVATEAIGNTLSEVVEETSSDVITDDLTSSIEDLIPEEPAQTEVEEEKETQVATEAVGNTLSEVVEESTESAADNLKEEDQKEPEAEVSSTAQAEPELSEATAKQVVEEKVETEVEENQKEPETEVSSTAQVESELSKETYSTGIEEKSEISGELDEQTSLSESAEQVVEAKVEEDLNDSAAQVESDLSKETYSTGNEEKSEISGELADQTSLSESAEQVVEEKVEIPNGQESDGSVAAQVTPLNPETTGNDKPEDEVLTQSSREGVSSPTGRSNDSLAEETATKATISPALVKQLREETGAGMMDCKKALSETGGDITKAYEYLRKKGLASADKKASRVTAEGRIGSYIHDSRIGVLIEVNCETDFVARGDIFKELVEDIAMQVAACPQVQYINAEDVPKEIVDKETEIELQKEDLMSKPEQIRSKIVEGRVRKTLEELSLLEQPFIKDDKVVVKDWVKQRISTVGENIKVKRFVRYNLGEGLEKKSQDFAAEVAAQTAAKPASAPAKQEPAASETKETTDTPAKAVVSAALVKQLREETGAGMMDCKKALSESEGDLEKAHEYLRKKGLSSAEKKSKRLAAEGRIGSYIHDSRIGVLIEVNCETDFVGRSQNFKELVDDLAMQVVACPQVQYVSIEDVPESIVKKEKELELQREDLQSKPENIREKIVEGRITKRLGELTLLEQPFIKNDSVLVKDLVKQTVATIGENIKVRRFVRFTLGESGDEKKESEA